MKKLLTILLFALPCFGQAWSGILDSSRATDWRNGVGFTIPSYSVPCSTQPSLVTGSGNAAANTTAIQNAIASCDSAHNVVNLPAGTYYVNGFSYSGKSFVVVRGVSPNSTYLLLPANGGGCGGFAGVAGVCMAGNSVYSQSGNVLPAGTPGGPGAQQCAWTAGYAQGTTTITLNSCGGVPVNGGIMVLDQADDTTDNGGIWLCSSYDTAVSPRCSQNGPNQNADGRVIGASAPASGTQYSQQQEVLVTSVSGSGSGPYTATISPGVYFNNVRSGQAPGAWWPTTIETNAGLENVTLDHTPDQTSRIGSVIIWCYQCWWKNVRSIAQTAPVTSSSTGELSSHLLITNDLQPVIRDSYFFNGQHTGSESYGVQMAETSGCLIENNIMQQTPSPDIADDVTGCVIGYNFTPLVNFGGIGSNTFMQGVYASHNSGSSFTLFEGNSTTELLGDDVWGTSDLMTIFRNQITGWQPTATNQTFAFSLNAGVRAFNIIGNILGQPGYHTQYSAYATSTTVGVHNFSAGGSTTAGPGTVNLSIYELGWTDTSGTGVCNTPPICDPLTFSTMFRWGNYDVVDGAPVWNAAESSPGAVPYVNANSTPASQTLPASFYLTAKPSWFGAVSFPAYGPDVASGSTGICSGGSYDGVGAVNAGQCTGGLLTPHAWGGFANANPAQNCFLSTMAGPPDGSGNVLAFDANTCYATTPGGNPSASYQTIPIATATRTAAQGQVLVCHP